VDKLPKKEKKVFRARANRHRMAESKSLRYKKKDKFSKKKMCRTTAFLAAGFPPSLINYVNIRSFI
jgi:hypothetical protein